MYSCNIISLLALFQASVSAITWSPTCNADNCLRGLFGTNVRTTAANIAACSTGLPTVTVLVDGTVSTTMTATVAPPAVASVCDGQGVNKRAARFQSACSCIGIKPTTVTQTVTTTAVETVSAGEVTLGGVANADNAISCDFGAELLQVERTLIGPSYTVPRAGQIISATTFDGFPGSQTMEIWRPSLRTAGEPFLYTLVGKSGPLYPSGSGTILSFPFPQPIAVEANDVLGMYNVFSACLAVSGSPGDFYGFLDYNENEKRVSTVGTTRNFGVSTQYVLNVAAVLRFD